MVSVTRVGSTTAPLRPLRGSGGGVDVVDHEAHPPAGTTGGLGGRFEGADEPTFVMHLGRSTVRRLRRG